jgi:hypothetical protein
MQSYRLPAVFGLFLAFNFVVSGSRGLAATPEFTITATNVTMSSSTSSGTGSSSFTLTSVNGYTGQVRVECSPPTATAGVSVPYCGAGVAGNAAIPVLPPITLTANEVVTGSVDFYNAPVPCSNPCPASLPRHRGYGQATGLALAGALLLGFGSRRKAARWFALTLLAVCALAGLAGISACSGGNNNVVTPGTYAYTISATDIKTSVSVTASINVIVP